MFHQVEPFGGVSLLQVGPAEVVRAQILAGRYALRFDLWGKSGGAVESSG